MKYTRHAACVLSLLTGHCAFLRSISWSRPELSNTRHRIACRELQDGVCKTALAGDDLSNEDERGTETMCSTATGGYAWKGQLNRRRNVG